MKTSNSLFIFAILAPCANAFVTPRVVDGTPGGSRRSMVGGKGWDNSDFLSGLSGDEDDRKKANEEYQEFSERRKSFLDRQKDIMKTTQGRAFLEKQQQQMQGGSDDIAMPTEPDDDILNVGPGSGGGSRMAQMMAQAKKMKEMQDQMKAVGFEQKLAVPLDDDEEDEEESS